MEIKQLKDLLNEYNDNLRFEYDLKKKNWFNIGGKSKLFYLADNLKELINFLKKINNKERIFLLGAGSNTLISDNFFDGVVIKLGKNFNNISLLNENVIILPLICYEVIFTELIQSSNDKTNLIINISE